MLLEPDKTKNIIETLLKLCANKSFKIYVYRILFSDEFENCNVRWIRYKVFFDLERKTFAWVENLEDLCEIFIDKSEDYDFTFFLNEQNYLSFTFKNRPYLLTVVYQPPEEHLNLREIEKYL